MECTETTRWSGLGELYRDLCGGGHREQKVLLGGEHTELSWRWIQLLSWSVLDGAGDVGVDQQPQVGLHEGV